MFKKIVKLEVEDLKELERAHYDYNGYRDNINFIMESHRDDPDFLLTPAFIEFRKQFNEAYKVYEEIKAVMTVKYVPETLITANDYEWDVNFDKKEMTITSNTIEF